MRTHGKPRRRRGLRLLVFFFFTGAPFTRHSCFLAATSPLRAPCRPRVADGRGRAVARAGPVTDEPRYRSRLEATSTAPTPPPRIATPARGTEQVGHLRASPLPPDLAGPVVELRRQPSCSDNQRALLRARVRPRHHPFRPRQQLRPAPTARPRTNFGRMLRARTSRRTATSSSSRRRPATPCGRVRTATGGTPQVPARQRRAVASRCMGRRLRRHLLLAPRRPGDPPIEETIGALDTPCGRARRSTSASRRTARSAPPTARSRRSRASARRWSSTSRRTRS